VQFRNKGKHGAGEHKIGKGLRHDGLAYEIKEERISQTEDPPSCLWKLALEHQFAR
jgi:hypothetical protein